MFNKLGSIELDIDGVSLPDVLVEHHALAP